MWLQIGKTTLEINMDMYFGYNDIYSIFKDNPHNLCFLFQKKNTCLFHKFTFFVF